MSGALVRLDMPDQQEVRYTLDGFFRADAPPGPAGSWLLQRFAEQAVSGNCGTGFSGPAGAAA
jgi:hypothetical protein